MFIPNGECNHLLSGKLPTVRQSYLLSGKLPTVRHAPNRSIDMHPKGIRHAPKSLHRLAPNNRILCTQQPHTLHPATAYFAPNRSIDMHPKGAYMHPKVAAYMHPKFSFFEKLYSPGPI